jgi:hypothetical protein
VIVYAYDWLVGLSHVLESGGGVQDYGRAMIGVLLGYIFFEHSRRAVYRRKLRSREAAAGRLYRNL